MSLHDINIIEIHGTSTLQALPWRPLWIWADAAPAKLSPGKPSKVRGVLNGSQMCQMDCAGIHTVYEESLIYLRM